MPLVVIAIILWIFPAFLFLGFTYFEKMKEDEAEADLWFVSGLLCCVFWPITFPGMVIYALMQRNSKVREKINICS